GGGTQGGRECKEGAALGEERRNGARARSIDPARCTLTGLTSTPTDDATDWMTANWPVPEVSAASRNTAARITPGATCLSSSSHFALRLYSNCMKPVALPPGRDRLLTKPAPTGSATLTNTIGTVRVSCSSCPNDRVPEERMTSGAEATSSAAYLRTLAGSAMPQRDSICRLRPAVQPSTSIACRNASMRACPSASPAAVAPTKTPIRRAAEQHDEVTPLHVGASPPNNAARPIIVPASERPRGRFAAPSACQGTVGGSLGPA